VPQILGALIYLIVGAYQVGVFTQRMTAVEKAVDMLSVRVSDMAQNVEWRKQ